MEIRDYFTHYSSKEERIINEWLNNCLWLNSLVEKAESDNTGYHDAKITLTDGTIFLVEVKEDEPYWYNRTGNIGIDYLSAFQFISDSAKKLYTTQSNYWVKSYQLENFIKAINVGKWGKLFTCDADIQLFYVKGHFFLPYNNCKLQQHTAYFEKKYNLRINKKSDYGINENWESAAFFIKPKDFGSDSADKKLVDCEVNNLADLKHAIDLADNKYPGRINKI